MFKPKPVLLQVLNPSDEGSGLDCTKASIIVGTKFIKHIHLTLNLSHSSPDTSRGTQKKR